MLTLSTALLVYSVPYLESGYSDTEIYGRLHSEHASLFSGVKPEILQRM